MFAIAGGKGGCGKTTTALGLANALADRGLDPLVVDADVDMPDLHILAGVSSEPNTDRVDAGTHIECVRHRLPDSPGISVVPAGTTGPTAATLERLGDWHGPVILDCPAGASEDATRPLRAADATVLVTTDTPQSLSDARKTAGIAERTGAPVRATLIRGPDAGTVRAPRETVHVERIGNSTAEDVLADPSFRRGCASLADCLVRSGDRTERGGIFNGR